MSTEEKVELESVPLKFDTDVPVETEAKPAETGAVAAPKKTWFFKKACKKSSGTDEKAAEEGNTAETGCKKKCWWRREKTEEQQKAENISIGINLVDRDERGINEHVKFGFEDIFGETDTTHSWDCVWRLVFRVFTWTRQFVYRLATWFAKVWKFAVEALFDPLFASIGLIWSRITTRTYGINSQLTDVAIA